jgi:hypothetical protein
MEIYVLGFEEIYQIESSIYQTPTHTLIFYIRLGSGSRTEIRAILKKYCTSNTFNLSSPITK